MGIFIGLSCIATSIWNMKTNKGQRALYALGLPLGICCFLVQAIST